MYCTNCGTSVTARFCGNCGASVGEVADEALRTTKKQTKEGKVKTASSRIPFKKIIPSLGVLVIGLAISLALFLFQSGIQTETGSLERALSVSKAQLSSAEDEKESLNDIIFPLLVSCVAANLDSCPRAEKYQPQLDEKNFEIEKIQKEITGTNLKIKDSKETLANLQTWTLASLVSTFALAVIALAISLRKRKRQSGEASAK